MPSAYLWARRPIEHHEASSSEKQRIMKRHVAAMVLCIGAASAGAQTPVLPRIFVFSSDKDVPEEDQELVAKDPLLASRMNRLNLRMAELFQTGLHKGLLSCDATAFGYFSKDDRRPLTDVLSLLLEQSNSDHVAKVAVGKSPTDIGLPRMSIHLQYATVTRQPDSKPLKPSFIVGKIEFDEWYAISFSKYSRNLDEQLEDAIRAATESLCKLSTVPKGA